MKEYEVSVSVQAFGQTLTVSTTVEAYSESEARTTAEEEIRNNLLVCAEEVECLTEEENEEEL